MGLTPDFYFEKFYMADADFLISIGVRGIILDVDNTLEPYENAKPGKEVTDWLSELTRRGISAAIVSNNNKKRIDTFNAELSLLAFSRAAKPFAKNVRRAMRVLGTDKTSTVLMGDQIFTDVWAARNAGIRAILVPPINDKRDIFTKFKRLLERPILKKYWRKHKK